MLSPASSNCPLFRSHPAGIPIAPLIRQVRVRSDSDCHGYGFFWTSDHGFGAIPCPWFLFLSLVS
jgi:hypothetical protein